MLSPQKKKLFAFFGSPPKSSATTFTTTTVISTSPMSSPNISSSILASYFPETTNFNSENNNNNISNILGSNIGDDNKKRTLSSSSASVDDIKKSIENLERLISSFNDYYDLINKLGKTSKDINKSLKCYAGGCKGMDINHVTSIQATAQFYESNAEVQLKLFKSLQKELELLQKFFEKYSKKAIKEERIYNELILDLDNQVKKTGKDYEKKSKKENNNNNNSNNNSKIISESHEKYISSMTSIGSDIARARTEYSENVKKREKNAHSFITQVIHRSTEAIFNSFNDSIKKCGQNLTKNSSSSSSNNFLEFLDNDEQQQQASLTISTILSTSPPNSLLISSPNSPPISSPSSSRAPIDIPVKRRVSTYKPSHQVTASIASMVELQKAAMDYISPKSNNHYNYNNKNNGDIGGNSKYKTIEINDDEDKIEVENADVKKNTKKENKKEENTIEVTIANNISNNTNNDISNNRNDFSNRRSNSGGGISISQNNIETNSYYHRMSLTSNDSSSSTAAINSNLLLTRVSIGVHDDDQPFLRDEKNNIKDGHDNNIIIPDNDNNHNDNGDNTENGSDDTGNNINNEDVSDNKNVLVNQPDKNVEDSSNMEEVNAKNQNQDNVKDDGNSSNVENSNKVESSLRPMPSYETQLLVNSFPIDLPVHRRLIRYQQQHQHQQSFSSEGSYNDNDNNNDNNVSKSNTTPISNKCGSSVAYMKEKLLSSMNNSSSGGNTLSSSSSSSSLSSRVITKQGYVNQVKSKFDDAISNNSNSNNNDGNSSGGGDDDTIKFLKKNCNCHNCQQISAVINSSMKED